MFRFNLLQNHHQTNYSKNIFMLAFYDDVIKCTASYNHVQNHDMCSKESQFPHRTCRGFAHTVVVVEAYVFDEVIITCQLVL